MSSTPRTKYGEYKEKLKEWSRLFEDEYGRRLEARRSSRIGTASAHQVRLLPTAKPGRCHANIR